MTLAKVAGMCGGLPVFQPCSHSVMADPPPPLPTTHQASGEAGVLSVSSGAGERHLPAGSWCPEKENQVCKFIKGGCMGVGWGWGFGWGWGNPHQSLFGNQAIFHLSSSSSFFFLISSEPSSPLPVKLGSRLAGM